MLTVGIRPSSVPMSSSPPGDSTSCCTMFNACCRHSGYGTMLCAHLAPPHWWNTPAQSTGKHYHRNVCTSHPFHTGGTHLHSQQVNVTIIMWAHLILSHWWNTPAQSTGKHHHCNVCTPHPFTLVEHTFMLVEHTCTVNR